MKRKHPKIGRGVAWELLSWDSKDSHGLCHYAMPNLLMLKNYDGGQPDSARARRVVILTLEHYRELVKAKKGRSRGS